MTTAEEPGADTETDADTGTHTGAESETDTGSGREAIVRAARRAFTLRPYAEVTLRSIAADAGVSPSLIVKRFGSKERLFNTVADFEPAADALFSAAPDVLGRHLVLTTLRLRDELRGDPLLRVVFSLGIDDERTLLRERFREQVTARLMRHPRRTRPGAARRADRGPVAGPGRDPEPAPARWRGNPYAAGAAGGSVRARAPGAHRRRGRTARPGRAG